MRFSVVRLAQTALIAGLLCTTSGIIAAARTDASAPAPAKGIAAEVDSWEGRDMTRDPKADVAALAILRQRADADPRLAPLTRAKLLTIQATASFYAMDFAAAASFTEQAAAIYEAHGGPADKIAEAYNNRSAILRVMGKLDAAEAAARKAVELRRALYREPNADIASSLYNLGTVLYSQGRYEEAVAAMREALRQQEAAQPDAAATLLQRMTALAAALNEAGREDEGIELARRAEQVGREKLGDAHPVYSVAINNLGTNLNNAGRFAEAIPVLREALRVRVKAVGEDHVWTAYTMRNLAFSLEAVRKLDEAQALNEGALAIMRRHTDQVDAGFFSRLLGSLATIAAYRGDWPLYDRRIAEAIDDVDKHLPEASPDRAYTHVFHASILSQRGRHGEALPIAEKWVPVIDRGLPAGHRNRIWADLVLASLRQHAGDAAGALALADPAVAQLRAQMSDLSISDAQLAREVLAARKSAVAYLQIAAAQGDQERIFTALQLAGMTDLSLGQSNAAKAGEAAGPARLAHARLLDLARRESELEKRYARALQSQTQAATPETASLIASLTRQRAEVHQQRLDAVATLRRDFPDFANLLRPEPMSLADFRKALAPGELVLAPVEWPSGSWTVTIDRTGLHAAPFVTAEAYRHVDALRAAVDNDDTTAAFPFADAHGLYRMLLPQGTGRHDRLLVFGGHRIASLPLSMLVTRRWSGSTRDAPWLVRGATTRVVGNLALFAAARKAGRAALTLDGGVNRVMGFGGPDLPEQPGGGARLAGLFRSGRADAAGLAGLPPLPDAERELQAIATAFPGKDNLVLVGASAGEARIKAMDLTPASVIAFATHGLVAGEIRGLWEPALLVGGPGEGENDGLLGASEIAQLRLKAQLVILSACNTAAGEDDLAPPYSGLATAFAEAGARSLLLSHWRVRDDAAARLSVGTVRRAAAGGDLAEALRAAQLDLIRDRHLPGASHPATWAPFVLVGN